MIKDKYPKICLGAWAWGNDGTFGKKLTKEELEPVFDKSIELGLNLWDSAYVYGMGESEKVLGSFLNKLNRDKFYISAKFTPQAEAMFAPSPVLNMFKTSTKLLNVDYVDFYWVHNPINHPKYFKELIPLLKEGKIKHLGVSNYSLKELKEANEILNKVGLKIEGVQNHYSIINRSSETSGIIDYCKDNDIIFFSYMVLEQGALTGVFNKNNPFPSDSGRGQKYNPILDKIEIINNRLSEIAKKYNATNSQIAISYAINKGTLPIIGATKINHVIEAKKASDIFLLQEEINELEDVAKKLNISTIREWEKEMK